MAWSGAPTRRGFLACVLFAVLLTACGGDPDAAMTDAGARAARDAVSQVNTTRIVVRAVLDGKIWGPAADRIVTEAETTLSEVATSFDARQPSTERSQQLYDQVSTALAEAVTAVTDARIAIRNRDNAALPKRLADLGTQAARLQALGEVGG